MIRDAIQQRGQAIEAAGVQGAAPACVANQKTHDATVIRWESQR